MEPRRELLAPVRFCLEIITATSGHRALFGLDTCVAARAARLFVPSPGGVQGREGISET